LFEKVKNEKREIKREISKFLESFQAEKKVIGKLLYFLTQQPSQVDDEKTESFSQFIFRFDSLGYQIF